jgi:hypothetical protein
MRRSLTTLLAALTLAGALAPAAQAGLVSAGIQQGVAHQAAVATKKSHSGGGGDGLCSTFDIVVSLGASCAAKAIVGAAGSALGSVVSSVGNSVLDAIATWVIGAATTITAFIARQMSATTSPQLTSSWYEAQFAPMAALGGGLALLVTLIALTSAALRRNGEELARTLAGIVRAGLGTGVVIALTMIGLRVADAISTQILQSSPVSFWSELAKAWGQGQFAGFGSSMLATLVALLEVIGALAVWLELIVRNAAIYIAVLFFPVALAAGIWRPLAGWPGRLGRMLLLFVMLKPVALIVLSLAGNAAAAGISGASGISASIGTILAAVVIFGLAALAPWALMFLLAADAESAWQGNALRAGASGAATKAGGAARAGGGGLAGLGARRGGSGTGAGGQESRGSGRSGGSGGSSGGGGSSGPSAPSLGGAAASASNASSPTGAVAAGAIGGGSVAAAAGMAPASGASAGRSTAGSHASASEQPAQRSNKGTPSSSRGTPQREGQAPGRSGGGRPAAPGSVSSLRENAPARGPGSGGQGGGRAPAALEPSPVGPPRPRSGGITTPKPEPAR